MEGRIFDIQRFSLHDGPGIRTVVFLQGCPLRCAWCANPESQPRLCPAWDGAKEFARRPYTVNEVAEIVLRDADFYAESGGGVTLSGGEPLFQPGFAAKLLRVLREKGIHTALETTGLTSEAIFQRVAPLCDVILFDVKHYDSHKHHIGTRAHNAPILRNLRWAVDSGRSVLPRIPVIPGFNDSLDDAVGLVSLLLEAGLARVELLSYHSFGEGKYQRLGRAYPLTGIPSTRPESLASYAGVFVENGIACIVP